MGPLGWGGLRLNPSSQDPITVTDTTTVRIVPDTTEHYRALYVENTELWRMARGLTHPSSISPEIRWWNMTCARLGGEPLVWEEEEDEEEDEEVEVGEEEGKNSQDTLLVYRLEEFIRKVTLNCTALQIWEKCNNNRDSLCFQVLGAGSL